MVLNVLLKSIGFAFCGVSGEKFGVQWSRLSIFLCAMTTDTTTSLCQYCAGQGFITERDCSGQAQYEMTCPLCGGTGELTPEEDIDPTGQSESKNLRTLGQS